MKLTLSMTKDQGLLKLESGEVGMAFAEKPYRYAIAGRQRGESFEEVGVARFEEHSENDEVVSIQGIFGQTGLEFRHTFRREGAGWRETIELVNASADPALLERIEIGFVAQLNGKEDWRLCAVPFRVQLDGSVHDYSAPRLIAGEGENAVYTDESRETPPLREDGLRSEAWAWGDGKHGIAVIKYNNEQIEYSMAQASEEDGESVLRFGGAGYSWYSEPSGAQWLEAGSSFAFGDTFYFPYEGGSESAFAMYRNFLEERNHTFGRGYNPPVNWNVLYDVGWHHSDPEKLRENYNKQAILAEAAKAKESGCELLYLDPGWEVAEGLTLWDESRLGSVSELVRELKNDYGLDLGYRTILRAYKPHWEEACQVKHSYGLMQPERMEKTWGYHFWEPCLCDPVYFEEKLKRILAITGEGVKFMMFDEMDWRGPCHDPKHGHQVPSTPLDHIDAVCRLAAEVRKACPDVLTEVHDPVSPWATTLYAPTYFRQGAPGIGDYDENWGFEYMWNCLDDLKSGKALALYYYNLGCSIPLYLHITMAADNDACVFFWWTASTVRHLGIGGKTSHPSVEVAGKLAPYDKERRFGAYQAQMALYRELKPYFVRGKFHGIAENVHLHTLDEAVGGVINAFNLEDEERELVFSVPAALFGVDGAGLPLVEGADASLDSDGAVTFKIVLAPMSPGVIAVGEAASNLLAR